MEYGWYRSPREGADAGPGSSHRYLAGWERTIATDLNLTLQYWGESFTDAPSSDDRDHLITARLEKLLHYQTVRISLFGYHDPEDGDSYLRAFGSYDVSDEVKLTLGANVFRGRATTMFGAFDSDDNVYTRFRYTF